MGPRSFVQTQALQSSGSRDPAHAFGMQAEPVDQSSYAPGPLSPTAAGQEFAGRARKTRPRTVGNANTYQS